MTPNASPAPRFDPAIRLNGGGPGWAAIVGSTVAWTDSDGTESAIKLLDILEEAAVDSWGQLVRRLAKHIAASGFAHDSLAVARLDGAACGLFVFGNAPIEYTYGERVDRVDSHGVSTWVETSVLGPPTDLFLGTKGSSWCGELRHGIAPSAGAALRWVTPMSAVEHGAAALRISATSPGTTDPTSAPSDKTAGDESAMAVSRPNTPQGPPVFSPSPEVGTDKAAGGFELGDTVAMNQEELRQAAEQARRATS